MTMQKGTIFAGFSPAGAKTGFFFAGKIVTFHS
jgi:hypothetical protein